MNTSAIYHTAASDIPTMSLTDKCIVLDLDETLINTQEKFEDLKKLGIFTDPKLVNLRSRVYTIQVNDLEAPGIGTQYEYWGVTRPHTQEFLIFCFSYFKIVAVWSAGKRQYVEEIVKYLFKDLPYPHVVFTRDDIVKNEHDEVEKPLVNMIESEPMLKKYMGLENTLALDDNYTTYNHNPGNGVLLPPYAPACTVNAFLKDDYTLLQFKNWLLKDEVASAKDVRELDKSQIFTTSLRDSQQGASSLNFK